MKVKRFLGSTIQDAVAQVRDEFGADAVILDTRTVNRRGLWRLFGRPQVEVVAALGGESTTIAPSAQAGRPRRLFPRPAPQQSKMPTSASRLREPIRTSSLGLPTGEIPSRDSESSEPRPAQLVWQMYQAAVKDGLPTSSDPTTPGQQTRQQGEQDAPLPPGLQEVKERLIASEMDGRLAKAIVQSVWHDGDQPLEYLAPAQEFTELVVKRMVAILRCVPPWQFPGPNPQVVALIGPTGVGKTTTLAKIAANYSVVGGADVGLVTLDTYRIGAVEQLRAYAEIIGIPLEVAETGQEVRQILQDWRQKDLILMDTAGMSQRDTRRLQDMDAVLRPVTKLEKHLVFSATTRYRDLVDIVRRYAELGFDRLIATKLDETTSYGILLTAYALARRPYSFLADGQAVPECIQVADSGEIVKLILGAQ